MSVRIGIGLGLGSLRSPQDYWRCIDDCEDSGIGSIWYSDQLLGSSLEPMALLAARTSRLRFGTNALVLPFREPLTVAMQLATIHFLSSGRVFPVLGVGKAVDPYWEVTGAQAIDGGRCSNESITLLWALLAQEEVVFTSAHFQYHGPGIQPRPQTPIPLWTGGHSKAPIWRTAELGDGWLGGLIGASETKLRIEAALAETGRTIEADHYGVSLPLRIGAANDPSVIAAQDRLGGRLPVAESAELGDAFAVGPPESIVALLRRYVAQGMSKFVVLPIANDAVDLKEQTQLLVRHVLPAIEDRS